MQERHRDRFLYFQEQEYTTKEFVIPYIKEAVRNRTGKWTDWSQLRVLEIGCGEGGNLKPFMDLGCQCVGIDLNEGQIEKAREYFSQHPNNANLELVYADIYDVHREDFRFDIVMLRDVIEHIHEQERFMPFLKNFLTPDGVVFFAFPPWYMPFGGHQQVCVSKISKMPYIHLLSRKCYGNLLRRAGEEEDRVEALLEIKDTGISIERFERILRAEHYQTLRRTLYLFNPNYKIKFHLPPTKLLPVFRSIPFFRNFYTTAAYYVVADGAENK